MAAKQQEKVKLEAHAGENVIPADKGRMDLPVLVKVVAPSKKERTPIDLVALLDMSPSMEWKRKDPNWTRMQLVQAAMELAMKRLGAPDRLAIVPFSEDVNQPTALLYMDSKGQADALHKVLSLKSSSPFITCRFIPTLNYAKRLLDGRSVEEKHARPAFVFLLSAGEDNGDIIRRHVDIGYPVHTFGMCQTCNPQAMLHVARETNGTYHHIDDNVKSVALALGNFIGGITSVVAVDTRLHFTTVPDGSAGVRITKIESGNYACEWSKGTEGHINVGVMYANDEKKFVVHLSVPALMERTAEEVCHVLLAVTGGYSTPVGRKREAMDEQNVMIKRTVVTGGPKPIAHPVVIYISEVAVQVVMIQVASIVEGVVHTHVKDDGTPINQKLMAQDLINSWESFKAKEAVEKQIQVKYLSVGQHVIEKLSNHLIKEEEGHTGVLYVHSWLAAHATQQVTTFATSSTVDQWFCKSYMALVAQDLVYHATSMVTPPGTASNQDLEYSETAMMAKDQQQVAQVTVSTVPVLAVLPREKERRDFEVLVRVQAPTDARIRAPIDLVVVVDVSGSMRLSPETNDRPRAGEPSRLDLLKNAMKFIVGHLPDGDRLAIVAFDHNVVPLPEGSCGSVLTEISDATRTSLNDTVNSLETRGWTLFAPGLDKAVKILEGRPDTDKEKRVGSILFLSDGEEASPAHSSHGKLELLEGYASPNDWKKLECKLKDHTVHTFGFSKFHDPSALHAIARLSGGTYSFLNTGLDKITDAFAFCLGGLKTVVATGVTIDLAVQDPKVRITGIDAGGYGSKVNDEGRTGGIAIPVLYAGEVKDFIIHLNVPSHGKSEQELLRVDGLCRLSGESAIFEIKKDKVTIERPQADDLNQPKQNGEVIKQVLRFKVLKMLKEFLDKTKGWDLKKDEKRKGEAEMLLGAMWDSLKAQKQPNLSDLDELHGVVESYDGYVKNMQADLKNGDGGAHVLAFDSSNSMQQVTTMGSPENVVPHFKTEEIQKMGGEAKKQRGEPCEQPQTFD